MLLENKTAVIYGSGGAIGGAVARAFAREGARVFLSGRRREPVEAVAQDIDRAGGFAMAAEVDALDEEAVEQHLQSVVGQAGRVDISFNAVGLPNAKLLGVSALELDVDQFTLPIVAYTKSYFVTARRAARRMVANKSGVILSVSAIPGRTGTAMNGGYGPAMAAKDALTRDLSAELAPHGIRVVSLRPHAMPESSTIRGLFEIKAKPSGQSWEQFREHLANWSHSRRVLMLEELANTAAFVASDRASALTGTTLNLTMGGVAD